MQPMYLNTPNALADFSADIPLTVKNPVQAAMVVGGGTLVGYCVLKGCDDGPTGEEGAANGPSKK